MPSRAEEKLIRGLRRRKVREAEGLFLAEGIRVVEELLASGIAPRLAIVSPAAEASERGRGIVEALEGRTTVRRVGDGALSALAATESPQGILVVAEIPAREPVGPSPAGRASALVLDGIQDPGNFGTMVRTADAFGVHLVAALPGTVDPWNPKSVRAAAGASFRVPITQPEPAVLLEWLRRNEFAVYGAETGGVDIGGVRHGDRIALVIGNEGAGLSAAMRGAADALVAIPIEAHAESLNAAVASGILLYVLTRRG